MTHKTGTVGQFMAWTKRVIRDPKAAKENPKRWADSEKTGTRRSRVRRAAATSRRKPW